MPYEPGPGRVQPDRSQRGANSVDAFLAKI